MIYTDVSRKHMVTANLVWVRVYIYMLYIYYIHIIYKIYTKYILPGIFQSYADLTNMPGIYLLHNKWVCSVAFFIHKDIQCISQGYNYKKRYGTNP